MGKAQRSVRFINCAKSKRRPSNLKAAKIEVGIVRREDYFARERHKKHEIVAAPGNQRENSAYISAEDVLEAFLTDKEIAGDTSDSDEPDDEANFNTNDGKPEEE